MMINTIEIAPYIFAAELAKKMMDFHEHWLVHDEGLINREDSKYNLQDFILNYLKAQ